MITAKIKQIKHTNPDGSWVVTVGLLESAEDPPIAIGERASIVGALGAVEKDDVIQAFGEWTKDNRWGVQYKVSSCVVTPNPGGQDVVALFRKLGGLTLFAATKLIGELGGPVAALAKLKAGELDPEWTELYRTREELVESFRYVGTLELTANQRAKVFGRFAHKTKAKLEEDPYCLLEVDGFGWASVDDLCRRVWKVEPHDRRRLLAIARCIADQIVERGDTWAPVSTIDFADSELGIQAGINDGVFEPSGDSLSVAWLARLENEFADHIRRLSGETGDETELSLEGLSHEQEQAVRNAVKYQVSILTGGPGTGKSHTLRKVTEHLPEPILMIAPTGKAAKRMTEMSGVLAKTIHSAIGLVPGSERPKFNEETPLPFASIIIDEASMVDLPLFVSLFRAISDRTRIVITGDADQLPSIGPGAVLRDLLEQVPTARLSKIFRQASESAIPWAAREINEGRFPTWTSDVAFQELEDPSTVADSLVKAMTSALQLPGRNRRAFTLPEIQILTPQNKGPIGAIELNKRVQEIVNPVKDFAGIWVTDSQVRVGDRVIHTKNNRDLGVYNGETGTVIGAGDLSASQVPRDKPTNTLPQRICLIVDFGDKVIAYPKEAAKQLRLAYAITVHKSQGSQFPAILMPVHVSHSYMLTRALFYTGLTRAVEFVGVVGDRVAVRRTVANTKGTNRRTSLREALCSS